jgi:integrase
MTRPKPINDELLAKWIKTLKPQTGRTYRVCLLRILKSMNLDSRGLYESAEADPIKTWRAIKQAARAIPSSRVRLTAQYAARRFLLDQNEDMMLPNSNLKNAEAVREPTYLTWDDAQKICDAASLPYNIIFKIMLQTGWGAGEFLTFNKIETWRAIKAKLASGGKDGFFRFGFKGRKNNRRPFYSLIPMRILSDAVALEAKGKIKLPLSYRAKDGRVLSPIDDNNVIVNRNYLWSAFETALKRAPIILAQGKPSLHELRDTFLTRAIQAGCSESAANFVMGHVIDKLGYNKCDRDEKWLSSEISKIHGPAAVTENTFKDEISQRDALIQQLQERLAKLEKVYSEKVMVISD